ncbi:MAG: DUF7660 family protein [Streptomyces sp.]|uniref:DUF7660 family protein n=1 Tax=Streptomyces sp. TaxID=1931 RepID=UPI003D6AF5D6
MSNLNPNPADVQSRDDLYRFLVDLAQRVKSGEFPMENESSVDYVKAAAYWIRSMHGFFANRGEQVPADPEWSTIAMIFTAAFVYE